MEALISAAPEILKGPGSAIQFDSVYFYILNCLFLKGEEKFDIILFF